MKTYVANIRLFILLLFVLFFVGCKKDTNPFPLVDPRVLFESVVVSPTSATFTWIVDWPGKLVSVVEVSEHSDMSDARVFGSEIETENHNFTVTATDLKESTKYYYRYLIWNRNYEDDKYEMEVKVLTNVVGGMINGLFSVSPTQQVYFSQGNLQYIGSTNTWKFADHQWDMIGTSQASSSQSTTRDLFGWGTSGYNHGANCYQPWSTSQTDSDYYVYGNSSYNLYDQTGKADWGYNAIANGGNQENSGWRTLTHEEWVYVFSTRTTSSGIRYAKAKVNNVNGVILLPDNWSSSTYSLSNTNEGGASYSGNTISSSQWSILENAGAVFLPAAGSRLGASVGVGSNGGYWSASCYSAGNAWYVYFNDSYLSTDGSYYRCFGRSVRLVRSAQ